jgi:hypothetical protein
MISFCVSNNYPSHERTIDMKSALIRPLTACSEKWGRPGCLSTPENVRDMSGHAGNRYMHSSTHHTATTISCYRLYASCESLPFQVLAVYTLNTLTSRATMFGGKILGQRRENDGCDKAKQTRSSMTQFFLVFFRITIQRFGEKRRFSLIRPMSSSIVHRRLPERKARSRQFHSFMVMTF